MTTTSGGSRMTHRTRPDFPHLCTHFLQLPAQTLSHSRDLRQQFPLLLGQHEFPLVCCALAARTPHCDPSWPSLPELFRISLLDQGGPLARAARAGGPWPPPAPVCRPAQRRPRATQRAAPHHHATRHSQHLEQLPQNAHRPQRTHRRNSTARTTSSTAVEGRLRRAVYMAGRPSTAAIVVVRVATASGEGRGARPGACRSSAPARCGRPPYCRRHGCGCVSRPNCPVLAGGEQLLPRGGSGRRGRSASVSVSRWPTSVS